MSKSKVFENDLLKLIFNGEPIEGLADNASSPLTELFLALHYDDPDENGDQTTNEIEYTGYERVPVVRSPEGWVIENNVASPTVPIEFGEMVAGNTGTARHITIGTHKEGEGKVLYRGTLTPTINFDIGVVPRIRTTSTITED